MPETIDLAPQIAVVKERLRQTQDPGEAVKLGISIALLEAVQAQDSKQIEVIMRSDIVISLQQ